MPAAKMQYYLKCMAGINKYPCDFHAEVTDWKFWRIRLTKQPEQENDTSFLLQMCKCLTFLNESVGYILFLYVSWAFY